MKYKTQLTPGRELIARERQEQLDKHEYTIDNDVVFNSQNQLSIAAATLCLSTDSRSYLETPPLGWNKDIWKKMIAKSYKERLIISGALIAAEIDRISVLEIDKMMN